jgi:hypothetical protein
VGDRGGDFGDPRYGEGTEREPGDSGRRFVASEPVEKSGEAGQRDAERRGVARIVEDADRPLSQFDQGYANNGPVTANKRSDISAQKIRSQIARAKNLNSAIRSSSPSPTSCRMTVLSRSRSPGGERHTAVHFFRPNGEQVAARTRSQDFTRSAVPPRTSADQTRSPDRRVFETNFRESQMSSIPRQRSVPFGPGRFGRRRTSPSRR